MSKDEDTNRPVVSYKETEDNKGRLVLKPTYLQETPQTEIDRLNKEFPVKKEKKK